jgi:hypothetical protein
VQLRRIASFLGMQPGASPETPRMAQPTEPSTHQDIAMAAAMAGMRAFEGRMADPLLDLID